MGNSKESVIINSMGYMAHLHNIQLPLPEDINEILAVLRSAVDAAAGMAIWRVARSRGPVYTARECPISFHRASDDVLEQVYICPDVKIKLGGPRVYGSAVFHYYADWMRR